MLLPLKGSTPHNGGPYFCSPYFTSISLSDMVTTISLEDYTDRGICADRGIWLIARRIK